MGICHCVDANIFCNEMLTGKIYYTRNNLLEQDEESGLVRQNRENRDNRENNRYAEGRENFNNDRVETHPDSKFNNYKKNTQRLSQENYKLNRGNLKTSVRKNLRHSYESNRSEILFEEMSNFSKTYEIIDYYQNSKIMFELINDVRTNPGKYLKKVEEFLKDISISHEINNGKPPTGGLDTQNNFNQDTLTSQNIQENLNNNSINDFNNLDNVQNQPQQQNENQIPPLSTVNSVSLDNSNKLKDKDALLKLKDYLEKMTYASKQSDFIIWSEKVYLASYEYLIEVEEKENLNKDFFQKTSERRLSEKLKLNTILIEFNVYGLYSPEIIVLLLFLENLHRLDNILVDSYVYGSVCSFAIKSNHRARTIFYFVKKNSKQVYIKGTNPNTGIELEISLNEYIFDKITYKDMIISGTYEVKGEILKVKFNLLNGCIKDEDILIS
jgi:hypothetical protein